MKLVETHALSVTLRGGGIPHIALNGVSVCIKTGQHTALLGPNGAGKSTLLKVLQGSQWPDQNLSAPHSGAPVVWYPPAPTGQAREHGASSASAYSAPQGQGETSPLVGRAMSALVSAAQHEQYVRQAWDLSGAELLLTGFDDSPLLYTLPQPKQEQAVQAVARKLRLEHLLERSITTLSQGQMRLLLLARAIVRQPALLLLDECLDGLDGPSRDTVLRLLDEVRHTATIILTAHRQHSLPAWLHSSLYVHEGRVYTQPPAHSTAQPPSPSTTLTAVSTTCEPQAQGPYSPMPNPVHPASYPQTTAKRQSGLAAGSATPLLILRHASVYVERSPVLHDINWTICQGEHWLLRGANGSGKSTLLRLLAGDEYPALGGSIERYLPRSTAALGQDHAEKTTQSQADTICELEKIRRGIRLVSDAQQAGYDYDLSAQEVVLSGFDGSIGVYRDFSPAEYREALYWLRRVGMDALAQRTLRSLSTGQARRIFIARALVGRPDILLLDEPCSGLDSQSRASILSMLSTLAADSIHTVLVSHHGEDRLSCSNREGTVTDGQLRIDK